jgi:hypothetical protein
VDAISPGESATRTQAVEAFYRAALQRRPAIMHSSGHGASPAFPSADGEASDQDRSGAFLAHGAGGRILGGNDWLIRSSETRDRLQRQVRDLHLTYLEHEGYIGVFYTV